MKLLGKRIIVIAIALLCVFAFAACDDSGVKKHTHDFGEWSVTTPASCGQDGVETRVCKDDATHTETRPVPALGHDWNEWTQVTAPTATLAGEEKRVCKRDASHTETRAIPSYAETYRVLPWHNMQLFLGAEFTTNFYGEYNVDSVSFGVRDEKWMSVTCTYMRFGTSAQVEGGTVSGEWSVIDYSEADIGWLVARGAEILEDAKLVDTGVAEPHSVIRYKFNNKEYLTYVFKDNEAFYRISMYSPQNAQLSDYEADIKIWMSLTNFGG